MNESNIAAFLAGDIDAESLSSEVRDSERNVDAITTADRLVEYYDGSGAIPSREESGRIGKCASW